MGGKKEEKGKHYRYSICISKSVNASAKMAT
jgi:hypothetical protein